MGLFKGEAYSPNRLFSLDLLSGLDMFLLAVVGPLVGDYTPLGNYRVLKSPHTKCEKGRMEQNMNATIDGTAYLPSGGALGAASRGFRLAALFAVALAMGASTAFGDGYRAKKGNNKDLPVEVTPVSHMESRTRDKTRDPGLFGDYWWANRFLSRSREIEKVKGKTVDVVMLGDSIIHFWEWKHPQSWAKFTAGRTVLNLGYGGDRTEQVIWRISHGELDGYTAKCVVLMIGTNNNTWDTTNPDNVALGVEKIIAMIRERQPGAKIVLHPVFPRGKSAQSKRHAKARERNDRTNALLKKFADDDGRIIWIDFNSKLVDETGWVPKSIMPDEIHPSDAGYDIWMAELSAVLGR